MSMKINFDITNTPENPTLILAYRDGRKIGELHAENIIVKDSLMNPAEISFKTRKFIDNKKNILWDKITNFKLVWYKEADLWFEIYIDIDESNETIKNVLCAQLGQAELSQIMLYDIEINTENDIARDDYEVPTVLYNNACTEASLLHRIMEKANHYSVVYVDNTIANIQRTFTFDSISIYDAMKKIAEEIGCLFVFHSDSDENGKIRRAISVYDLQSNCNACGYRGEFTSKCPKCESVDINEGYGEDTTIFITPDELAEDIQFTSDTDSIKNCFKLEAGDDLMTATIRNCNPNGTDYIWYISDDIKADMSDELVEKLKDYDNIFNDYQKNYIANIDSSIVNQYNELVKKYQSYNEDLQEVSLPIQGYPALMTALYNTVDLSLFLESALMPSVDISGTSAEKQAEFLTADNLSPVAVADVSKISLATVNSIVLSIAKIVIDSRYRVKVNTSSLIDTHTWEGNFVVTNYSDDEDEATSDIVRIVINDDYEYFVKQKLDKAIKDKDTDDLSITGLFKKEHTSFCDELKKYGLNSLTSFHDACQACIDILIEQGVADSATWSGSDPNLYNDLYNPYYNKLKAIESELKLRQNEINLIKGVYDSDGILIQNGLQPCIETIKNEIQKKLDFQNYIGEELWLEFCSYRREDKYSNNNYISDGLSNSELFEKALEFIEVANNEIYKSAELQHSISAGSLNNLLVIKKFKPITKYFKTGNWLRVLVDDKVYKLRLLEYEIDFDDIDSISVDFSDVLKTASGETDQKNIISQISSISTSYSSVKKQASQGAKSDKVIQQWHNDGLDATTTKIIGGAEGQTQSWDSHGMLFREYDSITDTYSDEQLKIINSTLAITTDNWETTKTAIGTYYYFDKDKSLKKAYGVNAETIVGKFIIGEQLSMSNNSGTMTFDENGLVVRNGKNTVTINPNNEEVINITNGNESVFNVNEDGELSISGNIMARSLSLDSGVKIESGVIENLTPVATSGSYNDLKDTPNFSNVALTGSYNDLINTPSFAIVATTGNYNDLTNKPNLFSGSYKDLSDVPNLSSVALSGNYNDLINVPVIKDVIEENNTSPVCGKAVYDFALSKKQDLSNADTLLYVNADGDVVSIGIDELKTLLGI